MKKLRMIVTSVVVLAIVGSAFAFHAKIQRFCVLTTLNTGTDDNCTTAIDLPRRTTTGVGFGYKIYPFFDGNVTACATANNHHCTDFAVLTQD